MKTAFSLTFLAASAILLAAFFTDNVDLLVEVFLFFSIVALTLLPIMAAFMLFLALVFSLDRAMNAFYDKLAMDKELANTVASHLYFIKDMGPSVSSVSIVAFFVATDATRWDLMFMFFTGVIMKYLARKLINIYYENINLRRKELEEDNDNGCNS